MCRKRPNKDDEDFGMIALQNNLVEQEALKEMQRAQKDYAQNHNEVPPLGMLMFEKRVLQENQVIAILKAQERKGRGLLHFLKQAIDANREETLLERILGPEDDPVRRRQILIAGGLGLAVVGIWLKMIFGRKGDMIDVMCESCGAVYQVPWTDEFPLRCKKCGKESVYWVYKCHKCGKLFTVHNPQVPTRCPFCNSTRYSQPKDF